MPVFEQNALPQVLQRYRRPAEVGSVESVADDVSGTGFSRQRALPFWAAETLHCF